MPDAFAAAGLVQVASNHLLERIISLESLKVAEQSEFVRERREKARPRFERAQNEAAAFVNGNRALHSATGQVRRDKLQCKYDLTFEIYQHISQELEQARIKMDQDTPVFTVLDPLIVPTGHTHPLRGRILIVFAVLGVLQGIVRVGLRPPSDPNDGVPSSRTIVAGRSLTNQLR